MSLPRGLVLGHSLTYFWVIYKNDCPRIFLNKEKLISFSWTPRGGGSVPLLLIVITFPLFLEKIITVFHCYLRVKSLFPLFQKTNLETPTRKRNKWLRGTGAYSMIYLWHIYPLSPTKEDQAVPLPPSLYQLQQIKNVWPQTDAEQIYWVHILLYQKYDLW